MSAVMTKPPPLIAYVCPVCLPRMKRVLTKASAGSVVEVYCRHCKFKKVVLIS